MRKFISVVSLFALCVLRPVFADDSSAPASTDLLLDVSPEEVSIIPPKIIAVLPPRSIDSIADKMTIDQVRAIPPQTIAVLSPISVAEMNAGDLNPDQIQAIPPETLAQLPPEEIAEFDALTLRRNQIQAIPVETFKELPREIVDQLAKNATPLQLSRLQPSSYPFGGPKPANDSSSENK